MNDSKIITPTSIYAVVVPGFQGIVSYDGSIQDFVDHIEGMIVNGRVVLRPQTGVVQVIHVSKYQHFTYLVMTKQEYDRYQTQQQLLQNMGGNIPGVG